MPYKEQIMTVLIRSKSTGEYEAQEMSGGELVEWFRKNSDEEGNVQQEIIQFGDAEFKAADNGTFPWIMSDYTLDRDVERIDPDGWDLKAYRKNPVVLWAHNIWVPAIGKLSGVKVSEGKLQGKVTLDSSEVDPFAGMIAQKVANGTISAGSVGYRSTKVEFPQQNEEDKQRGERARLISRKQELYEFSICNVPSNPTALVQRGNPETAKNVKPLNIMLKGGFVEDEARSGSESPESRSADGQEGAQAAGGVQGDQAGAESASESQIDENHEKAVIPYKDLGFAEDNTAWDGPAQIRQADTATLKVICTWYDSEKPDVKGSYKLPHHRAGDKKAVWRGVTAAMGALLGARGGANIPAGDRRGVYNHLVKHYRAHGTEPPDFKGVGTLIFERLEELERKLDSVLNKGGDKANYVESLFGADRGKQQETSAAETGDRAQETSEPEDGQKPKTVTSLFVAAGKGEDIEK